MRLFVQIKEKFTNETVTGGCRWAEITERKNEKVYPNSHVREKTVLEICSTNDHRDT